MQSTVTPRRSRGPTRRELWLSLAIIIVLVVPLLLHGDPVARKPWAGRPPSSATLPVPTSAEDVTTILNNTPLAITPADAVALNAARPNDRAVRDHALPFVLPRALLQPASQGAPSGDDAALTCMTQAIYYEAASETDTGKRAVAQVVLNRMRSPLFPHSVCGVVFQGSAQRTGCQFSFTCDGSLGRTPSGAGWASARRIALAALAGSVERSVGLATHYHANYVVPYWAGSLDKVATIGAHIFYTMRGGLGRPTAFGARYDAAAETAVGTAPAIAPAGDATAATQDRIAATTALPHPVDRTVVKDDSLGAPIHPGQAIAAPSVTMLRADEGKSELVADRNRGSLSAARPSLNAK